MKISELKEQDRINVYEDSTENGSMQLEHDGFVINVPNGYGDGQFDIIVLDENSNVDFNRDYFFTSVYGEFEIKDVLDTKTWKKTDIKLNGWYFIYTDSPNDLNINIILEKHE